MLSKVMNSTAFILARSRLLYVEIRWGRVCLGYSLHPKTACHSHQVMGQGFRRCPARLFGRGQINLRLWWIAVLSKKSRASGAPWWQWGRPVAFQEVTEILDVSWYYLVLYGMKTFWSCDFFSVEGANGFRIVQENLTSRRPAELTEFVYFLLGTGSTDVIRSHHA